MMQRNKGRFVNWNCKWHLSHLSSFIAPGFLFYSPLKLIEFMESLVHFFSPVILCFNFLGNIAVFNFLCKIINSNKKTKWWMTTFSNKLTTLTREEGVYFKINPFKVYSDAKVRGKSMKYYQHILSGIVTVILCEKTYVHDKSSPLVGPQNRSPWNALKSKEKVESHQNDSLKKCKLQILLAIFWFKRE